MGAFIRGTLLFVPLIVFWHLAGAPWDALSAGVLGVGMIAGVAAGRPWTAWISASDWQGMAADPLFLRVNLVVSAVWGLVMITSGVVWWAGAGPIWGWAPTLAGAAVSTLLPPLWVRRQLAGRLEAADPHPWSSPLASGAGIVVASSAPQCDDVDVAVVGAGLGGLTAAALLARAGAQVAVFEQHDKPGGFCHCWEGVLVDGAGRRTFRFDGGVHDVSGWFDGGTVKNLLDRLDLAATLSWQRMDHAFIHDGRRWDVPRGWDAFVDALVLRFPSDAAALRSLLADVKTIFGSMYATAPARGGVPGLPSSVGGLQAFARQHPLAVRWMRQPFDALLDHHRVSSAARRLLNGLAGYVTHDPSRLTVAEQVPLLGYFLHGGHYPVGGSGALSQALADSIALDGGEIHLSCPVEAVDLSRHGQGIEGLRLADGRRIRTRCVVHAGDAIGALRLLQPSTGIPPALRDRLGSLKPATSMFSVHLGVEGTPPALPPIVHLHRNGYGGLEIVLPSVVDRTAAPEGCYTVELMRLVRPQDATGWFDGATSETYLSRKADIADRMIEAAGSLIPGLAQSIVFRREASPLTFRRYGRTTMGSVYGVTDAEGFTGPLTRRSVIPGLVFAGSAIGGAGVEPAMMSGAEAADALLPGLLAEGARYRACSAA